MTITGVAERVPARLAQLVYLDAVVPEDGRSANDILPRRRRPRPARPVPAGVDRPRARHDQGPGRQGVAAGQDHAATAPELDRADRVGNLAAAGRPPAFIHCTRRTRTEPFGARRPACGRTDWRDGELAENHFAPVNDPKVTAEVLLSLA